MTGFFRSWQERRRQRRVQRLIPDIDALLQQRLQQYTQAWSESNQELSRLNQVMQAKADAFILMHPDPERLLREWNRRKPELVDELHEQFAQVGEAERQVALETWKAALAHYTQVIEAAVAARRSGYDDNA